MKELFRNIGVTEVILLESIVFSGLWIWDDYIARLVTFIMVPILLGVLMVALISELLERSTVPTKFFWTLAIAAFIPLAILMIIRYFAK